MVLVPLVLLPLGGTLRNPLLLLGLPSVCPVPRIGGTCSVGVGSRGAALDPAPAPLPPVLPPSVVSTNGISAGMGWRCVFSGALVRRCALAGVVSVHRQMGGGGGSEALQ